MQHLFVIMTFVHVRERECCAVIVLYGEGALHIHDALIILSRAFLLATQNEVIATLAPCSVPLSLPWGLGARD